MISFHWLTIGVLQTNLGFPRVLQLKPTDKRTGFGVFTPWFASAQKFMLLLNISANEAASSWWEALGYSTFHSRCTAGNCPPLSQMNRSWWCSWLCIPWAWPVSQRGIFASAGNPCISSPTAINSAGLSFMRFMISMKCQSQRMHLTCHPQHQRSETSSAGPLPLSSFKTSLCAEAVCEYVIGVDYLFSPFIRVPRG